MAAITRIQARRGTSSAWSAANPILDAGEMGWDTTALKLKVGNGTSPWNSLAYAIDAALAGKANTSHTHAYSDIDPIEIGAGVNLNDLQVQGDYFQSQSNETGWALNYPVTVAGHLAVRGVGGLTFQTYISYGSATRQWWRSRYLSTWSEWKEVSTGASTNTLGTSANPVTSATAARPTGMTSVWWLTTTKPTNWASGDIWMVAP